MARRASPLADSRGTWPARHGPRRTLRGSRAPSLGRGPVSDRCCACQPDPLLQMPVVRVVPVREGWRHDRLLVGRGRGGLAAARDGDRRLAAACASGPASDPTACTRAPAANCSSNIVRAVRGRARCGSRAVSPRTGRIGPRDRPRGRLVLEDCPQSTAWRVQPSTHTFRLEAGRTVPLDTSGARAADN